MTHNVLGKFSYQIRKKQREKDAVVNQPKIAWWKAWLGDKSGNLFTLNGQTLAPGYVVIRNYDGILSQAYNQRIPLTPGLPVIVGYDPLQPTLFQVLSLADTYANNPALAVPQHHQTHEWPGTDTVFVHSEQFLPGLVAGNSGFIVTVYPFFYKLSTGGRGLVNFQAFDFTSYIPASGAQAFTLYVDDSEVLGVLSGGTQTSPELITQADFSVNTDATKHELWGVRLYSGQTAITQSATYTDLYDLRFGGISGGGGGGGGGGSPLFTRVLSADLTLLDTQALVTSGYVDAVSFKIDLQGDAVLDVL